MNAVEIFEWVRLLGPLLLIAFLGWQIWLSHRALKKLQKEVRDRTTRDLHYNYDNEELP